MKDFEKETLSCFIMCLRGPPLSCSLAPLPDQFADTYLTRHGPYAPKNNDQILSCTL